MIDTETRESNTISTKHDKIIAMNCNGVLGM